MARALLPRLAGIRFDGIWRSDRIRAKETARLAGFSRVPADARLREIHFGDLEGKTYLEVDEEWQRRLRSFADFAAAYSVGRDGVPGRPIAAGRCLCSGGCRCSGWRTRTDRRSLRAAGRLHRLQSSWARARH
jgi:broad specificity phosphatase PhoE